MCHVLRLQYSIASRHKNVCLAQLTSVYTLDFGVFVPQVVGGTRKSTRLVTRRKSLYCTHYANVLYIRGIGVGTEMSTMRPKE